ncbi:hypothetical protein JJL56_32555 [Azospirillum sp. YIM DDC1]|uniref:VapC45 PIN like domain-containing protein n=1 Tax=Azospirillum aestuarii TaxID=2802052 RepID=A0ABS1I9F4_9PROT|nr:hypothetical protein [Azospirillum aestuarii]MBK4723574.1 hypothetical protein [Azospirillum aestuarii]
MIDNGLSDGFARGLNALVFEGGGCKVDHVYEFYIDQLSQDRWKSRLKYYGWCVLSGDQDVDHDYNAIERWANTGVPVFFMTKDVWSLPIKIKAATILLAWSGLIKNSSKSGLYVIRKNAVVEPLVFKPPKPSRPRAASQTRVRLAAEQAVPIAHQRSMRFD